MTASTLISVLALSASALAALFTFLGKRGETRVAADGVRINDDANLRDDQREYIALLQADNRDLRGRVAAVEATERAQARRIALLEAALRAASIPIPDVP